MSDTKPTRDPEKRETKHIYELGQLEGKRVLEIGCGNGRMTWRYAPLSASIIGIDPDYESLTEALDTGPSEWITKTNFMQADAQHLPFPKESFEAVVFSWSF